MVSKESSESKGSRKVILIMNAEKKSYLEVLMKEGFIRIPVFFVLLQEKNSYSL